MSKARQDGPTAPVRRWLNVVVRHAWQLPDILAVLESYGMKARPGQKLPWPEAGHGANVVEVAAAFCQCALHLFGMRAGWTEADLIRRRCDPDEAESSERPRCVIRGESCW